MSFSFYTVKKASFNTNLKKNKSCLNIPNFLKTDEDTIQTHNAGETIMQNILNLNAKFLQMEDLYNADNTYNFGFLPYYLAQKIVKITKSNRELQFLKRQKSG